MAAEWNFFATSHYKSACDGLGVTVKRLVTMVSMQCPYNDYLTSDATDFCKVSIAGIKFLLCDTRGCGYIGRRVEEHI